MIEARNRGRKQERKPDRGQGICKERVSRALSPVLRLPGCVLVRHRDYVLGCLLVYLSFQNDQHRADLMSDGSKNAGKKPRTRATLTSWRKTVMSGLVAREAGRVASAVVRTHHLEFGRKVF